MGNIATLKAGKKRGLTTEEAQKIGSLGGKRSVEVRRARKTYRELAEVMFSARPDEKTIKYIKKIFPQLNDDEIILKVLHLAKLHEKILKGDTRAFELLRDTAGEKPIDKKEIKGEGVNFSVFSDAMKGFTTEELQNHVKKLEKKTKKKKHLKLYKKGA